MTKIKNIIAREVLNAKGEPTVESTVILENGIQEYASSPTRTSKGRYEATMIIDADAGRFGGKGVLTAVNAIKTRIAPKLIGMDVTDQRGIDKAMLELDGTTNKSVLGANTTLSVSMAVAKAGAADAHVPLFFYLRNFIDELIPASIPVPIFSMINGGVAVSSSIDFEEILVIPASSKPYPKALQMGVEIHSALRNILKLNSMPMTVGYMGGFSPTQTNNYQACSLLMQAIDASSYRLGYDVFLGINASANQFYKDSHYRIQDDHMSYTGEKLLTYYAKLTNEFHSIYLEDPLQEDDWSTWTKADQQLGAQTLIVGNDLTATNPFRVQTAITNTAIAGIVIHLDQIGTVIEALAVAEIARSAGLKIIISGRSGETTDDFIADFSVAVVADYVKFGAPTRGEHVVKYNRLLQINDLLHIL